MMFDNIYSMKSADFLRPAFVIFSVGSVAAVLLISAAIVPHIVKDRSRIPVVIQGSFSSTERFVIFTLFSTPVATAAFPMAQAMGADSELAAELIVMSTTLSVVTLFFWTLGMQSVGMF